MRVSRAVCPSGGFALFAFCKGVAVLEAVSLSCKRGQRRVFSQLSLRVEPGQCWLVSGPNGSGKTSLLRILANIAQPESGQVLWRGAALERNDSQYRRELVYGGHAPGLSAALSVQENLDFLLQQDGDSRSGPDCEQALRTAGLLAQRRLPVRQLSAGQRRRVFLTRLALSRRPLWILDEQLTALDAAGQAFLGGLVQAHLARDGAVIMTSHQAVPWAIRVHGLDLGGAC